MPAVAVREKPILFSGPMIRAILAGTKHVTRRVVRWNREANPGYWPHMADGSPALIADGSRENNRPLRCPFGAVGDHLWVKETYQLLCETPDIWMGGREIDFWEGPIPSREEARQHNIYAAYAADGIDGPFRPSIHMPRWASRITLEIAGVRVERLQSITEEDAIAEGLERDSRVHDAWLPGYHDDPRRAFRELWDSINDGRKGCRWEDDPFCWVVEFRRIKP